MRRWARWGIAPDTDQFDLADPAAANRAKAGCSQVMRLLSTSLSVATHAQLQILANVRQHIQETQYFLDLGHCPAALEATNAAVAMLRSPIALDAILPRLLGPLVMAVEDGVRSPLVQCGGGRGRDTACCADVQREWNQKKEYSGSIWGKATVQRKANPGDPDNDILELNFECLTDTVVLKEDALRVCDGKCIELFDAETVDKGNVVKGGLYRFQGKLDSKYDGFFGHYYFKAILVTCCNDLSFEQVIRSTVDLMWLDKNRTPHRVERQKGVQDDKDVFNLLDKGNSDGFAFDGNHGADHPAGPFWGGDAPSNNGASSIVAIDGPGLTLPPPFKGSNLPSGASLLSYEYVNQFMTYVYCRGALFAIVEWGYMAVIEVNERGYSCKIAPLDYPPVIHCVGDPNDSRFLKWADAAYEEAKNRGVYQRPR